LERLVSRATKSLPLSWSIVDQRRHLCGVDCSLWIYRRTRRYISKLSPTLGPYAAASAVFSGKGLQSVSCPRWNPNRDSARLLHWRACGDTQLHIVDAGRRPLPDLLPLPEAHRSGLKSVRSSPWAEDHPLRHLRSATGTVYRAAFAAEPSHTERSDTEQGEQSSFRNGLDHDRLRLICRSWSNSLFERAIHV
jgi:hypothetical protein